MTARMIMLREHGGPEVMQLEQVELAPPGPGEVQIEQAAAGLNYIDVYQRRGFYPHPIPGGIGLEGAGTVIALGDGVTTLKVGDRVAYSGLMGAYASHRNAPANRLVPVPEGVSVEDAAALIFKGMTVDYLLNRIYPVGPGVTVLFYAASGGVGQIAGQWGAHLGATMIGVTSGPENCTEALTNGYAHAIDRTSEDIAARVRDLTGGEGVHVVYDSVGKDSFDASIDSLRKRGMFCSFGATTGDAPDIPPSLLQYKGSLFFTRPMLADYIGDDADYQASGARVFDLAASGALRVNVNQRHSLAEAGAAHEALVSGKTTGSTVLVP